MNHKQITVIIENEKNICSFMETTPESADYKVVTAVTGADGISLTASQCPDIILLDLGLSDMDRLDVLNKICSLSKVPVIIISAKTQEAEEVKVLDSDTDDHIAKPLGTGEPLTCIRTALKHRSTSEMMESTIYHTGDLATDLERRLVTLGKEVISLTQIEYKIVSILTKQAGRVLTYNYLVKEIWGSYTDDNNQILRVNMIHIRRKIKKDTAVPEYISTEIGVGYRMRES